MFPGPEEEEEKDYFFFLIFSQIQFYLDELVPEFSYYIAG